MTDSFSRRDLIAHTLPAMALGAAVLSGVDALAQDKPASAAAPESAVMKMLAAAQKDGVYSLPKLPYEYAALEPHIDAQTMELHHSKHHAAYVTNLNKAIDSLAKLRDEPEIDAAKLSALSRDISFNAGGHILHTVFFGTMTDQTKPGGGGGGDGDGGVHGAINSQYGSLDKFKTHFTKVAAGVKGSGWAIAWYEPVADKILITESGDQDLRMIPGGMPILLIDVWEHAYYLKHQNKRADYISAWWNVVRWSEVDNLYRNVKSMTRRM